MNENTQKITPTLVNENKSFPKSKSDNVFASQRDVFPIMKYSDVFMRTGANGLVMWIHFPSIVHKFM